MATTGGARGERFVKLHIPLSGVHVYLIFVVFFSVRDGGQDWKLQSECNIANVIITPTESK